MSEDPEKNQPTPLNESDSAENKGFDASSPSLKDQNLVESPSSSPESNVTSSDAQIEPQKQETWEDQLQKPINPEEALAMKKKKKEESRKKRLERQKQLETLTTEVIEKEFSKLFDKRTTFYFVFFLIGTVVIGLLSLLKGEDNGNIMQWWQITIALTMIFGFLMMLLFSTNKSLHNLLFHESKVVYKIVFMVLSLLIGFIIVFLYWYLTGSMVADPPDGNYIGPDQLIFFGDRIFGIETSPKGNSIEIEALRYQTLFGTIFAIIFFGWNVIQIWFIKNGLEINCIRIEARVQVGIEDLPSKNRSMRIGLINFITVLAPFLFHLIFTWIWLYMDTPIAWTWIYDTTGRVIPDATQAFIDAKIGHITGPDFYFSDFKVNHAAEIANMTKQSEIIGAYFLTVWWGESTDNPRRLIFLWFIIVYLILTITTIHQKNIFRMSNENKSPNVFSGFFFLFFWIIVWLKLFMIIKNAITLNETIQIQLQWYDIVLDYVVDLLLMLFTIFMVLRGFGKKIRGLKKSWITEYNTVFLMFLFVLSYFSGQMTIITGGLVGSTKQLSITTNIIVVIVNIIFYFWYSKWVMERKGFIRKSSFTTMETRGLLVDLSLNIKNNLLQTIENEEIIMGTLNKFMLDKRIVLETPAKGEEGVVSALKEEDKYKTSELRLGRTQDAYKTARIDLDNYEAAVKQLEDTKVKLTEFKTKEADLQKEIDAIPPTLEDDLAKAKNVHSEAVNQLRECQEKIAQIRQEIKSFDASTTGTTAELTADQKAQKNKLEFQLTQIVPDESKYQNAIQTAQTGIDAAQIKVDQANAKKAELIGVQAEIEKINKEIEALEINIKILKERADESQPALDAASVALESAKVELESFNALEKAKIEHKNAEQKFNLAQEKSGYASNQLKAAEELISATKTIEQAKADIKAAQKSIEDQQAKLEELRKDLAEKQAIMTEKNNALTAAQTLLQEKQTIKTQNDQKIAEIQAKLSKDKETLKNAQQLFADLEHANQVLKDAKAAQSKTDTVDKAENNLRSAQAKEKDAKAQLKEVKKQHESEPGTPLVVQEKVKAVDDAEEAVRVAKDRLRDAKEVQANIDSAQKHVTSLESQQLNIDQIKADITNDEAALKEATKNAEIPQKEFQEADVACQNAAAEFEDAKKQVEAAQVVITSAEAELQQRENVKAAAEKALADRQEAEKNLAIAKDTFAKGEDLLSKATKNLAEKKNLLDQADKTYRLRIEDARADWNIAVAHVELKLAHKTFKEAIRSAEANLKTRENRLKDAVAAKETLLKNREVITDDQLSSSSEK